MNRCPTLHPKYGQCALEVGHEGPHKINPELHRCHARNCLEIVKPEMLMCYKHWRMVPKKIQVLVWKYYRPGQCDDKRPSKEWMKYADMAIDAVAEKEKSK